MKTLVICLALFVLVPATVHTVESALLAIRMPSVRRLLDSKHFAGAALDRLHENLGIPLAALLIADIFSLVTGALHTHPAVVMYAEIFTADENARRAQLSYNTREPYAPDDYYRDGADPVAFLEQHVYGRAYPPEKKVVGFKLDDRTEHEIETELKK